MLSMYFSQDVRGLPLGVSLLEPVSINNIRHITHSTSHNLMSYKLVACLKLPLCMHDQQNIINNLSKDGSTSINKVMVPRYVMLPTNLYGVRYL